MNVEYRVLDSFKDYIKNISGINALVYLDSSIDIVQTFNVHPKVDLPLGTETSFIVVDNTDDTDLTSSNTELLLNRYFRFVSPSGTKDNKDILISSYNNITGQITLSEPLGEAVETTDNFEIEVLSSIFIRPLTMMSLGGSAKFNNKFMRFDMIIKTKEDSTKEKNLNFQNLISSEIGKYQNAEIKDSLAVKIGYMKFQNSPTYNEVSDVDSQMISYLGSVAATYYVNNFG